MKLAIMQPYFMPYIGYFQLINAVDKFVVYDDIQYTKKGWINRNRILVNGKDAHISLPLKKASDYLEVKDRYLAGIWVAERKKMLNKITSSYRKSPYFNDFYPLLESVILFEDFNLFNYLFNSIKLIAEYLEIDTTLVISSSLAVDKTMKSEEKVIDICKVMNAKDYVNPIGGVEFYDRDNFKKAGINLHFIKSVSVQYKQLKNEFVPWLSMIDILMFNSVDDVKVMLSKEYQLI